MRLHLRSLLLLCLFLLLYAGKGFAQEQGLTVTGGVEDTDYSWETLTPQYGSPYYLLTIKTSTPLTLSGKTTSQVVKIAESVTANLTLNGVDIETSNSNIHSIDISSKATLNLTLAGENKVHRKGRGVPLHVPAGASLIIGGEGKLTADADYGYAGIGSGYNETAGDITINSGTIIASGGLNDGAGIGGGYGGAAGNITINGGNIKASGSYGSAGIGGGVGKGYTSITINGGVVEANGSSQGSGSYNRSAGIGASGSDTNNGTITITGGIITARGNEGSAGIGGGNNAYGSSSAGTIRISGGIINATGGSYGIGAGYNKTEGTITIEGNAVIKAKSIMNASSSPSSIQSGIIFMGENDAIKNGKVYGNVTAVDGYTVEDGETLTIPTSASLTINSDKTITNKGTITLETGGTLTNNGMVLNYGTLPEGTGGKILSPFPNITITNIAAQTYTGQPIEPTPTVSVTDPGSTLVVNTDYTLSYSGNTDAGSNAKVIVTPQADKYFGDPVEKTFTISPAVLTVTPKDGQFHYQDENTFYPAYTYSGNISGETPAFTGNLAWDSSSSKIKQGTLALANNESAGFKASNYTLTVDENKDFTPIAENIADKEATLKTATGNSPVNGWYTEAVTIKAPTDFKIKQNEVVELRDAADWTAASLTFDQEGSHTVKYQLKRDGRDNPLDEKSVDIHLDKSAPTIGDPIKGADGKSFSLKLSDTYSGIASIAYNLNNTGETSASGFTAGDKSYTLSLTSLDYGTHSIVVTVTDRAGLSTSETKNIELKDSKPDKPVNPDPPIVDPTPTVYYTVTLPSVEGAVTDPEAGEYDVESWSSFRFYLTLDKDYDQSVPVVTTDRGETLTPGSNGAYAVKYVRSDIQIRIDGIVKNPDPVANEKLETEGIRIYAANGYLHIQTPKPEKVYIFTPDGRLKTMLPVTDSGERIALPKGVYFVKVGERVYKTVL